MAEIAIVPSDVRPMNAPASTAEWAEMRGKATSAAPVVETSDSTAPIEPVVEAAADPVPVEPKTEAVVPEEPKTKQASTVPLGELTKERNKRHAAEQAAASIKAEREADRVRIDKLAAAFEKLTAAQETVEPRPKRESFDNPSSYEDALLSWNETHIVAREQAKSAEAVKAEQGRQEQQRQQDAMQATYKTIQDAHEAREVAFKAETPDYAAVALANPVDGGPVISDHGAAAIMQVDNGPEVAYWLGKNVPESERIAQLHPIQQAIEIGRLSARLTAQSEQAAKEAAAKLVSRAPAPMRPVGGVQPAVAKARHEMSMAEYAANRIPELRAERVNGHAR